MTTPYERFRALQAARDLLSAIPADPGASLMLREQVAGVLLSYPDDGQLEYLITENAIGLPQGVAGVLSECSSLLRAVADEMHRRKAIETLESLRRICRHFPEVGEIRHQRDLRQSAHLVGLYAYGISSWIALSE